MEPIIPINIIPKEHVDTYIFSQNFLKAFNDTGVELNKTTLHLLSKTKDYDKQREVLLCLIDGVPITEDEIQRLSASAIEFLRIGYVNHYNNFDLQETIAQYNNGAIITTFIPLEEDTIFSTSNILNNILDEVEDAYFGLELIEEK